MIPPSTHSWLECEQRIQAFETAWATGEPPKLEDFLTAIQDRRRLLAELVHIDIELRHRHAKALPLEDYLERFPELAEPEVLLELIATERRAKSRLGQSISRAEYQQRFPALAKQLADGGALGLGLNTSSAGLTGDPFSLGVPEIPGFQLSREVGRGGMGVVFEAWQPSLSRRVAIKTLAGWPRPEAAARFRREAEAMARLDHPHIVPIYEVGTWQVGSGKAIPYLVMKWCGGGSLAPADFGERGDWSGLATVMQQVADAVHHAHERGVLHRDLKPSNILLDEDRKPHVADFGLAGWFDPAHPGSLTTEIVGTPAFMAPEQARAPSQVTTAADVYGLGALLYFLLTQQPPFQGETAWATLEMAAAKEIRKPSALDPKVPAELEAICLKCLQWEPRDRYSSAAAVADDLRRWQAGKAIVARPDNWWKRQRRFVRRQPWLAATGAAAAFALVAMLVTFAVSYQRVTESRTELAGALERERRQRYAEQVATAARLYSLNQLSAAWQLLDQTDPSLRGWEHRYLQSLRAAKTLTLAGHIDWIQAATFLPGGALATGDRSGHIILWDCQAGRAAKRWQLKDRSIKQLVSHPRKPLLASLDQEEVVLWDAATGKRLFSWPGGRAFAICPEGSRIAIGRGDRIALFDVASGQPAGELGPLSAPVHSLVFLSASELVSCDTQQEVGIWTVASRQLRTKRLLPNAYLCFALLDDPPRLVQAGLGEVQCVDPETGNLLDRMSGELAFRICIAVDPAGNLLAANGPNGEVLLWNTRRHRLVRTLRGHSALTSALAFSPDGAWLASGGGDQIVRVWQVDAEPEFQTFGEFDASWSLLKQSPDGRTLVVAPRIAASGPAQLRDAVSGKLLRRFSGVAPATYLLASGSLALAQPDGSVVLFDPDSGKESLRFAATGATLTSLCEGAQGRLLLGGDTKGSLHIWDSRSGRYLNAYPVCRGTIYQLALGPDRDRVAVAGRDLLCVWDSERQTTLRWSIAEEGAYAVDWHPGGQLLASADRDRVIRLRDAKTGAVLQSLLGSAQPIMSVAFDASGQRLASAGHAASPRVWDVATGLVLLDLPPPGRDTFSMVWDPLRDRIIGLDDHIRIWHAPKATDSKDAQLGSP